jgi:hypothetical protein
MDTGRHFDGSEYANHGMDDTGRRHLARSSWLRDDHQERARASVTAQRCPRLHALIWHKFNDNHICAKCKTGNLRDCVSCILCNYNVCFKCCSPTAAPETLPESERAALLRAMQEMQTLRAEVASLRADIRGAPTTNEDLRAKVQAISDEAMKPKLGGVGPA